MSTAAAIAMWIVLGTVGVVLLGVVCWYGSTWARQPTPDDLARDADAARTLAGLHNRRPNGYPGALPSLYEKRRGR